MIINSLEAKRSMAYLRTDSAGDRHYVSGIIRDTYGEPLRRRRFEPR